MQHFKNKSKAHAVLDIAVFSFDEDDDLEEPGAAHKPS